MFKYDCECGHGGYVALPYPAAKRRSDWPWGAHMIAKLRAYWRWYVASGMNAALISSLVLSLCGPVAAQTFNDERMVIRPALGEFGGGMFASTRWKDVTAFAAAKGVADQRCPTRLICVTSVDYAIGHENYRVIVKTRSDTGAAFERLICHVGVRCLNFDTGTSTEWK